MKHLFSHQQGQTGQLWSPTLVTLLGWSHAAASNRQNMEPSNNKNSVLKFRIQQQLQDTMLDKNFCSCGFFFVFVLSNVI